MKSRIGLAALAILSVSCVTWADEGHGRSEAYARAERHCAREAQDQGLRVEKIGDVEKVGKKQYEVKLRVDDRYDRRERKKDDFRVLCRYDDRERLARID